jgi:hypothetical protein
MICTEPVNNHGKWTIKVEDYHLDYATIDTTGVVTGGWLDLRGALKPLGLLYEVQGRWRLMVSNTLVRSQDEHLPNRRAPVVVLDVSAADDAFVRDMSEQRLFFMVGRKPDSDDEYLPVLLLRLCDVEKKLFERIRLAKSGSKAGTEMLLVELDEQTRASLPCLRYEDGLHTIRII